MVFNKVKNVSFAVNGHVATIIIGEQVFQLETVLLANFKKLERLFSSSFVFRQDFLSYEVAKNLFCFLTRQNEFLLETCEVSILVEIIHLAEYLDLQNWSILMPIVDQINLRANYNLLHDGLKS